jgi:hypothetical protein
MAKFASEGEASILRKKVEKVGDQKVHKLALSFGTDNKPQGHPAEGR